MREDFGAVVATNREGAREGCERDEGIIDPPCFEKACCIWSELETGLLLFCFSLEKEKTCLP